MCHESTWFQKQRSDFIARSGHCAAAAVADGVRSLCLSRSEDVNAGCALVQEGVRVLGPGTTVGPAGTAAAGWGSPGKAALGPAAAMAAAAPGPRDGHGLLKSTAARLLGPLGPRAIMPRPASLGDAPANLSPAPEEPPPTPTDRPRKKLSFREPEILGYYMQMKQGVASRLSRRGKQGRAKAGASDSPGPNGTATPSASSSSSCVSAGYGNANNNGGVGDGGGGGGAGGAGGGGGGDDEDCRSIHLSSSTEDLDLEVTGRQAALLRLNPSF